MKPELESARPLTRRGLVADLQAGGVCEGDTLLVHTRMSALGLVIGGADTVVTALLETLGEQGTLMVYTSWEHDAYDIATWSEERRAAYLADPPVFDPECSESWTGVGRIPERVRTWPGARRSAHPLARVAAIGSDAHQLVKDHSLSDGYGPTSPFARLVERGGQVLLLGAPLDTLTLLHHAEAVVAIPSKRNHPCTVRLRTRDGFADVVVNDIDTLDGAFDYSAYETDGIDAFAVIAGEALTAGAGRTLSVGSAECHLFDAHSLVAFAVHWLEERFGSTP